MHARTDFIRSRPIKFLTCQIWKVSVPAGMYVDYDDANINILFVNPFIHITEDEICVLLRVFC